MSEVKEVGKFLVNLKRKLEKDSIEENKKKGNLLVNLCMASHQHYHPTIVAGFIQKKFADTWVEKVSKHLAKAHKTGQISIAELQELAELGVPYIESIRLAGYGDTVNRDFVAGYDIYQAELIVEDLKVD